MPRTWNETAQVWQDTFYADNQLLTCANTTDCPGAAKCYEGICGCDWRRYVTGDLCDELTGEGKFITSLTVIMMVAMVILFFILTYLLAFKAKHLPFGSVLQTTLVTNTVAVFGIVLLFTYELSERYADTVLQLPSGDPRTAVLENIGVTVVFCFATNSLLNISLHWLELAQRVQQMSTRTVRNVERYRRVLVAYFVVFGSAAIALAAMNEMQAMMYLVMPSVLFLMITYFAAFFKLRKIMTTIIKRNEATPMGGSSRGDFKPGEPGAPTSPKNKSRNHDVKIEVRRMEIAALGISFSCFLVIIIAIGEQVVDLENRQLHAIAPPVEILDRFFWMAICASQSFLGWYLFAHIAHSRHLSAKKTASSSKNKNNEPADKNTFTGTAPGPAQVTVAPYVQSSMVEPGSTTT